MSASSTNPDLTVDEFLDGIRFPKSFYELSGLLHAGEPLVRPKPRVGIAEQDDVEADKARRILLAIANIARWNPEDHEAAKVAIECLLKAFHQQSPAYFSHPLLANVWEVIFEALSDIGYLGKPHSDYLTEFARRVVAWASGDPPGVLWLQLTPELLGDLVFQTRVDSFLVATGHYQYLVDYKRTSAIPSLCMKLWGTPHYFPDAHRLAFDELSKREVAQALCSLLFLRGDLIEKPLVLRE